MSTPAVHPFILEMLVRSQERMIAVLVERLQATSDEPVVVTNDDLTTVDVRRLDTEPAADLESLTLRMLSEDELAAKAVEAAERMLQDPDAAPFEA